MKKIGEKCMQFTKEVEFLLKFLSNHKLNTCFFHETKNPTKIDFGIRQTLGLEHEYTRIADFLTHWLQPTTIYKITDRFFCVYFILSLPVEEHTVPFLIGPYIHNTFDKNRMLQDIERYHITPPVFQKLQTIFTQLPILSDDTSLQTMIQTFGELIWGNQNKFKILDSQLEETIFYALPSQINNDMHSTMDIQMYESYLMQENNLVQAVSMGNTQVAEDTLALLCAFPLDDTSHDQLRNIKNYALSLNTIFRKAAEINTVNTSQVLRLATKFIHKIELCASPMDCTILLREIVRKYCLLIKNHSMKEYSPLIQQAIRQIDMDLSGDLSLHTMAKKLNSNASYLSTQFKKITGNTYTEYVQKKRMEHAIFLLNTTSLQIQTISQYCGISDLNYFSKIFKKHVHLSPTEYRKELTKLEKNMS